MLFFLQYRSNCSEVYCVPRSELRRCRLNIDRGSTYTASSFTALCKDKVGIRQPMGRVGSCF
jgi:putative transposase